MSAPIPEAAVEAGARALFEAHPISRGSLPWDELAEDNRMKVVSREHARAALTAALPALRAEVLAPVEDLLARYEAWDGDPDYQWKSSPKQRDELRAALAEADPDAVTERNADACTCGAIESGGMAQHLSPCPLDTLVARERAGIAGPGYGDSPDRDAERAAVWTTPADPDAVAGRDAKIRAEAWQEGQNAGAADAACIIGWGVGGAVPEERPELSTNPYLAREAGR